MKLLCPICEKQLIKQERRFVCEQNHSFDLAKQGYLNLLIRQSKDHGDNTQMVKARTDFLNTGAYGFLREELKQISESYKPETIVDLGCGEGYYTSVLYGKEKYGFDMSKEALKHAARSDKSCQYAVASIFRLPLPDDSCQMALTCFAPFAKDEIERVLEENGHFVFVSPGPRHLFELKEKVYQTPYENVVKDLETNMVKEKEYIIENVFHVDHDQLMNLFTMTPYVHRTDADAMKRLEMIPSLDITAQFVIRIYRNI